MAFLKWIIALPLIIGVVLFALANPQTITLTYSPIHAAATLPLYFIALVFLGIGFLIGAFMAWVGMSAVRAERRALKKKVKELEKDINIANEKLLKALSEKSEQENLPRPALPPVIDNEDY